MPEAASHYLYAGAGGSTERPLHAATIHGFTIESRPHLDLFNLRWLVTQTPVDVPGLVLREEWVDVPVHQFQSPLPLTTIPRTWLYEDVERMPRAALVRRARRVPDREAAIEAIGGLDPRAEVLLEGLSDTPPVAYPGRFEPVAVDHRGDRMDIALDAGAGGYLVVSEVWDAGWQAQVDGEPVPVHRANAIFRALELGPGPHEVVFGYRPPGYAVGRWISVVSLGVALLAIGVRRRR